MFPHGRDTPVVTFGSRAGTPHVARRLSLSLCFACLPGYELVLPRASRFCGADSGYRREAARLLPTVTALAKKSVLVNLDGQTLLDSVTTKATASGRLEQGAIPPWGTLSARTCNLKEPIPDSTSDLFFLEGYRPDSPSLIKKRRTDLRWATWTRWGTLCQAACSCEDA